MDETSLSLGKMLPVLVLNLELGFLPNLFPLKSV